MLMVVTDKKCEPYNFFDIMAVTCTIILLTLGLCEATGKICPAISNNSTHDAFGAFNYVQRGVRHQVRCPSFRPGEAISRVIWYRNDTTPAQTLITHKRNKDHPESDRYAFGTSGFSLVIKGVEETDTGSYVCQVVPVVTEYRLKEINIQVIGDTFPGGSSQVSSTASLQRGRRQTLPCGCASQITDVVYWSAGAGVTTDTQIIGVRFSDGATLQIQHGADYIIGSDSSLTINSLNDIQDTQRFWCHVFQSDGTLRNCDTDAKMSDEDKSDSDALKASERSFYLRKDTQQILPCLSWTPGDTACEVVWSKVDNPDRKVLSYNLSTGVIDSSPEFSLTSDFGLVIQQVYDDHAGVYRCAVRDGKQMDVEVQVIGNHFPLDGGSAIEGESVTFKSETRSYLQCPALSDISLTTKSTVFWSYGSLDVQTTTVIGTFDLVPDGSKTTFDQGNNDCFDLSLKYDLLLNDCSQDDDVRYWCHVFPANEDLIRSYVDVLIENSNGDPESPNISNIVLIILVIIIIVLIGICLSLIWKRLQPCSHGREDRGRGNYRPVETQEPDVERNLVTEPNVERNLVTEPDVELDLMTFAEKVKEFVKLKFVVIPITSWVGGLDVSYVDKVYKPLEMFVNVLKEGSTVKYPLDLESVISDDGISGLAYKHAIVQGRRGCGKTAYLRKLIYDWAMGKKRALWGSDHIVVLVPAWLLIETKNIGEAVVKCMLPKNANISAESINTRFARENSNLTILVDDCNDKDDIDAVMKVMADNGFLGCTLVLTTRNAELAKAASQKHNMGHVTITGFTLTNAIKYIDNVLDIAEERMKATPEDKADKSEAKAKQHLHQYLEDEILPSDISCIPAVLVALCQLSVWTKGEAFKSDVTMADLFFRLVKCLLDGNKGLEEVGVTVGVTEGHQLNVLTEDQWNVLTELGKVAHFRLLDSCAMSADYSKEDFLNSSGNGEQILKVAKERGFLRPLRFESKEEFMEQDTDAVHVVNSEVSGVEHKRRQTSRIEPMASPKDERVCFVLDILEQFCVAVFVAQDTRKANKEFADNTEVRQRESIQRFLNAFEFANHVNQFDSCSGGAGLYNSEGQVGGK